MNTKQVLISTLAISICATIGKPSISFAQAPETIDKSLAPLVMILIDTSTSMYYSFGSDGHNRLTKAQAEIAGAPKVDSSNSSNGKITILGSSNQKIYLPRTYPECTSTGCTTNTNYVGVYYQTAKLIKQNGIYPDSVSNAQSYDFANAYYGNGIIQSYMYSVKFGFGGMNTSSSYRYGKGTKTNRSIFPKGYGITINAPNSYPYGLYDGDYNANNPAPTLYPTVSDDMMDMYQSNTNIINLVRSYWMNSSTPIGGCLADYYFMFKTPDPALTHQYVKNTNEVTVLPDRPEPGTYDDYFACRPKAVLVITDGAPNAGACNTGKNCYANSNQVWWDAARLYTELGVRVYAIAYAQSSISISTTDNNLTATGVGNTMNKIAWKGGTCRDPDTNEIVSPTDDDAYKNFIKKGKICFFNAADNSALRTALVTALSDMLNSFISKTRIATTTAISLKNNYDTATKTYNSGYYNVYSGYEITMGQVRNTALQRESFICDGSVGQFNNAESQFIDLSNRLACRLTNCTDSEVIKRSGYSSAPTPCASKGNIYSSSFSMTNTCSRDRYIFAGDYSKNRYEIAPDVVTLLDKDASDVPLAGFIKQGKNTDTDYHFLTKNETSTTGPDLTSNYSAYKVSANYRLSPYECETDFDCGLYNQVPRHCDLGKCVNPNDYSTSCTDNASGKICINGRLRDSGGTCTSHASCIGKCGTDDGGCVCHAGKCLPGVVNDGDIRQFVSTQRLGTIEYATPVPVEAPFRSYSNTSYQLFSQKYWQRDTMLMAGSNDGMMHAFILGDNGGNGSYTEGIYKADPSIVPEDGNLRTFTEGDELWAFIPKGVMKNLYKLVKYGPQTNINATPIVMDVYDPNSKDVVTTSGDKVNIESTAWKTVMVGGFGNGGIGYYALDITNPGSPKILWEIDNLWQSSPHPEYPDMQDTLNVTPAMDLANRNKIQLDKADSTGYPFLLMGKSTAEPVITNMVIDNKIEPVVVLPGGSRSVDMGERAGAALYIVRLFPKSKENLLVKDFYFDNPITGSVAVYPNNFNSVAQHLYFGDSKANLYRIDVSSSNRSEWGSDTHDYAVGNVSAKNISPVFNPSEAAGLGNASYEAITYKPAVSLYKSEGSKPTIQIIYGTGSNDTFNVNSSDRHYVADFYDYYVSDSNGNGKYQLNDSSASFNPMIYVFNPVSSVTTTEKTYTSNGYTQKYHVYTQDPISKTKFSSRQKMTGAAITHNFVSYFPTFIANENAEDKCASGHAAIWKIGSPESNTQYAKAGGTVQNPSTFDAFATTSVLELPAGTKIYGLEITNQLYCLKDGKEGSSMAPQLVAQTSTEAPSFNNDTGSAKLKPKSTDINSLAINLDPIQPQSEIISWASVYE